MTLSRTVSSICRLETRILKEVAELPFGRRTLANDETIPGKKLLRALSSDIPFIIEAKASNAAICTSSAGPLFIPSSMTVIAWPKTG